VPSANGHAAPMITPYDPVKLDPKHRLLPPSSTNCFGM
jgi:hypothetical protein